MNIINLIEEKFNPSLISDDLDNISRKSEDPLFTPKMQWAHNFWDKLRGVNKMPSRGDFTPADIIPIISNLILLNVGQDESGDEELKFRLIASNIANGMGRDYTGVPLAKIPGMGLTHKKLEWVIRNKEPIYYSDKGLPWKPSWVTPFKFLALPLSEDGEKVNMIMMFIE